MNARLYHVIAVRERDGRVTVCTRTPEKHDDAVRIARKRAPRRTVRVQLWEVGAPLPDGCWLDPDDSGHEQFLQNAAS